MEDCLFVGNVETNPVPENPPSDPFAGNRQIGSTLSFFRSGGDNPVRQLRYEISNVHLLDNDDGGIDLIGADRASVRNLVIKDTHRMGAYIEVDTLEMTNVWIEGVDAWEANMNYPFSYWSPPFQVALGIHKIDQARIGNLTLVDNNTQFLFWTNDIDDPRLTVYNSILYGNEYEFFTHPVHSIAEYPPPLLRYTLLDEDYTGEGNIYYEDPAFDPVLGSPWLSPQSPAVDAGHPGTEWQDLENPEIPGTAHWPSQGDLRADMGFTGGPHALDIDTSWVALQRPQQPLSRPAAFQLRSAYPNPFNSQTTLRYVLAFPQQVKLALYNLLGQRVTVLDEGLRSTGEHKVHLQGDTLASGVYVVLLEVGNRRQTQKILVLK